MQKVGRNDFCPCGSGKKYKKCCEVAGRGRKIQAEVLTPAVASGTTKIASLFFQKSTVPIEEVTNSLN